MERRRLWFLGLGVTGLLMIAAVASSGHPLSKSRATGPRAGFFDYVFTTIAIFAIAITIVVAYAIAIQRPGDVRPRRRRWHLLSTLAGVLVTGLALLIFLHSGLGARLQKLAAGAGAGQAASGRRTPRANKNLRNARVRWDEVGVVLVLAAGVAVLLLVSRGARLEPRARRVISPAAVSLALDESLDDLRDEPDLRRAIIAAYARMERALAAGGIPRRPAEAPFEYVERALTELATSAASVHRLTDLFEWAKFSQHEPGPEMRDAAIEALVAVRDELRGPVEAAAA